MRVPLSRLPMDLSADHAVEAAYPDEVDALARVARAGESALVECDPELVPYLHRALKRRLGDPHGGPPMSAALVDGRAPERVPLGSSLQLEVRRPSLVDELLRELARLLREGSPATLLVVPHFELLAPSAEDGAPGLAAREVAALIEGNPGVPLLALHAPDVLVPEVLARAFTRRGHVGSVAPERLRHLVLRREGRKLDVDELDEDALAERVEGLNALELRRALARFQGRIDHDPRYPAGREALLRELAETPRRARDPRPLAEGPGVLGPVEWRLRRRDP